MAEIADETIRRNKRAARKQARQNDWDPDGMRVCMRCGRTVLLSALREDGTGPFCTCTEHGPPMVRVDGEGGEDG